MVTLSASLVSSIKKHTTGHTDHLFSSDWYVLVSCLSPYRFQLRSRRQLKIEFSLFTVIDITKQTSSCLTNSEIFIYCGSCWELRGTELRAYTYSPWSTSRGEPFLSSLHIPDPLIGREIHVRMPLPEGPGGTFCHFLPSFLDPLLGIING